MRNSERQVTGQKSEPGVQANTAGTLANHNRINQTTAQKSHNNSDNSQAPILLPYPMDRIDEVLSDLYLATVNVTKIIQNTRANPSLKKEFAPTLDEMEKKMKTINQISVGVSQLVDKMRNIS